VDLLLMHATLRILASLSKSDFNQRHRNRNLGISRAPLESQVHQGTSLFASADLFTRAELIPFQYNYDFYLILINPNFRNFH